jgi:hypothetical protein
MFGHNEEKWHVAQRMIHGVWLKGDTLDFFSAIMWNKSGIFD